MLTIVFEETFNPTNPGEEVGVIEKYFDKLNNLIFEKIGKKPLIKNGFMVGFQDGGQFDQTSQEISKQFKEKDLFDLISLNDPKFLVFFIGNIARYAIVSHGLSNYIKIGPLDNPPGFKISVEE